MGTTRIQRLTSPAVLLLFGVCTLAFGVVAFVGQYASRDTLVGPDNVVAGRDFLAFYTAGRMVLAGEGPALYDLERQQQAQDRILLPETLDGFLPFVNPASVALPYAALAQLPYRTAFFLHTAAMLALYGLGVLLLMPQLPGLAPRRGTVLALGLAWPPMLVSALGGQNAPLSFALLAGVYAGLRSGRDGLAGVALGLLLFKPQYAVPLAGLLLLRRRLLCVSVFAGMAALHYAAGAWVAGWDWPRELLALTSGPFRERERLVNGITHIAIPELVDYWVVLRFQASAAASWLLPLARAGAAGAVLAGAFGLVWAWRRADPRRSGFALPFALAVPVMLLISPHAQYYEIALLLLPVLLALDHRLNTDRPLSDAARLALVAGYFAFPLHRLAGTLPFQPLALAPVAVAAWILWEMRATQGPRLRG